MTSKHVIRESESPRPAASSILISRMTRSSVIIPYKTPDSVKCIWMGSRVWIPSEVCWVSIVSWGPWICVMPDWMFIRGPRGNMARKSRVYFAWRYEICGILASLGTVKAQPRFYTTNVLTNRANCTGTNFILTLYWRVARIARPY